MSSSFKRMSACPICNKEFPVKEIENHVDKCLFLTSENEISLKRQHEEDLSKSPLFSLKKSKHARTEECRANTSSETIFKKCQPDAKVLSFKDSNRSGIKCSPPFDTDIDSSVFKSDLNVEIITKPSSEQITSNDEPQPSTSSVNGSVPEDHLNFIKPLAETMRPNSLMSFIGQSHVLGDKSVLKSLLEGYNFPCMILWGPPGCGKTSLANIIKKMCQDNKNYKFVKMSATSAGVNDVKELVRISTNELNLFKKKTVLFMDEIHRFNKLQQDIFLPSVESGLITLIGATTENPSFSLNNALLSRCRVFVFQKLQVEEVITILVKATLHIGLGIVEKEDKENQQNQMKHLIDKETLTWLAEMSDGDARIALNSLQMAVSLKTETEEGSLISLDDIKNGIKRSHLLYDRKGDEHYDTISALHKSIRASDENAALYWLTRMLEGGEDPIYIARRLVRAASEDVGLSDPMALTFAVSAMQGCQLVGMPECDVILAHAVVYLARTHKSQEVYHGLLKAKSLIKNHKGPQPSIPLHLRNAPTKLMKDLGYGKGYGQIDQYMPEGMESVSFFDY